MGMLSQWDIDFMKNSVRDIIKEWNTTITLLKPLPLDKQTNYNHIMNEFTGDILYEETVIQAERKDSINNVADSMKPTEFQYGSRDDGTLLYAIPNVIDGIQFKPAQGTIVAIDNSGDRYYIESMRDRIGETLLTLKRYVGDVPNGSSIKYENIPHDGLADTKLVNDEFSDDANITGGDSDD